MPLPTLDKTHEFTRTGAVSTVNQQFTATGTLLTDCQAIVFAWIRAMFNFTTAPWTCTGSSNGTGTGALDAVNRWATSANLIWAAAGSNHSWIVLKSAGIGLAGGLQLCIDLSNASGATMTVVVSPIAGFIGGTATARPTATDEKVILSNASWKGASSVNGVLHVSHTTDDEVVNAHFWETSVCTFWFHASKPKNPITGWTKPSVYWFERSTPFNTSAHYTSAGGSGYISAAVTFSITGECVNGSLIEVTMSFADDTTLEWPFGPMGLYTATASNRGRKGQLFDMWWGSTSNSSADNYPNDGSKQFVQFGHVILPWNGSQPLIA